MKRGSSFFSCGLCLALGFVFGSCGDMWLDSGGMGVSIYDDGPYWQPAPPPPYYGPAFGPTIGWGSPDYYPGYYPGIGVPPLRPNPPQISDRPGQQRPPQNIGGDNQPTGGRPAVNEPIQRPSGNPTVSSRPNVPVQRPQGGASGRH